MKYLLNDLSEINKINSGCNDLHITRSFSQKKLKQILKRCKSLKVITISKSTKERLGRGTLKMIKANKIKVYTQKEQGRAIEMDLHKLNQVLKMYRDHTYRELEDKLNIPKSTIHYIIKYSKRKKLKDGNKIIYLK